MFQIRSHYSLVLCDATFPIQSIHQKKQVAIQKFNPPIIFVERLVFSRHFRFVHALVVPSIWCPKSNGSYYHPKHCRFGVRVCPISRQIHIPKSQLWLILSGFCLEVLICLMVAAHPHKPVMVFSHLCCLHPNFARKCWKVVVCLRVSHATFFSPHSYPLSENDGWKWDKSW